MTKEIDPEKSQLLTTVLGYLEKFDWKPESIDENNGQFTVTLVAQLDIKEIKILIKFADESHWIYFSALFLPKIESKHQDIYKKLLEINYSTTLTKFGLSNKGNIFALIELPSKTLDYEEFLSALRRLTNDINSYLIPIANILRQTNSD
ncbi:MAG: YbjN domain-containing protein [Candidatus Kariarchaeaceae archaeon]